MIHWCSFQFFSLITEVKRCITYTITVDITVLTYSTITGQECLYEHFKMSLCFCLDTDTWYGQDFFYMQRQKPRFQNSVYMLTVPQNDCLGALLRWPPSGQTILERPCGFLLSLLKSGRTFLCSLITKIRNQLLLEWDTISKHMS